MNAKPVKEHQEEMLALAQQEVVIKNSQEGQEARAQGAEASWRTVPSPALRRCGTQGFSGHGGNRFGPLKQGVMPSGSRQADAKKSAAVLAASSGEIRTVSNTWLAESHWDGMLNRNVTKRKIGARIRMTGS
jgi:hypothetical protein